MGTAGQYDRGVHDAVVLAGDVSGIGVGEIVLAAAVTAGVLGDDGGVHLCQGSEAGP